MKNQVALLAEGGDRNVKDIIAGENRATVALLAEGGDRNILFLTQPGQLHCRPPRGGRG